MAFLFQKFQEVVKSLAKSPTFARDPRQLQLEADINRLFLCTSYKRLGRNAEEADADEIINMASKASVSDQRKQVQDNIHYQVQTFSTSMDEILLPNTKKINEADESPQSNAAPRKSGLSFAIGRNSPPINCPNVPETKPLNHSEVSQKFKDSMGYTLDIKPSQIPHKDAGQGLFINGEADVGTVIAFYPGIIYFPAYYRYIPGYPRVDLHNPYLITRYDGTVINAQPWGLGGDARESWDGLTVPEIHPVDQGNNVMGSDRMWRVLSKPLEGTKVGLGGGDVLERRNPLAFAHFANHPAKDMEPNVIICPYDFPLKENDMRVYIPNIVFANEEEVNMRRFGGFWFKSGRAKSDGSADGPILKSLVLVATRALCDEEVLLNYRLSNSKRRPSWYVPVDEEEDKRRWS